MSNTQSDDSPGRGGRKSNEESLPLRLTLTVPDERAGQEVLRCLAGRDDSISVTAFNVGECIDQCQINVENVTDKQWEASKLAVESGYYQYPRKTDLDELSTQLGISASAASQRLSSVEGKLMHALVEDCKPARE